MTDAPKRIWARRHPTGVVEAADYKIEGEQQYHRADLSADLVRAALEAAAEKCDVVTMDHMGDVIRGIGHEILALAADPEARAAIVAQVMEKE